MGVNDGKNVAVEIDIIYQPGNIRPDTFNIYYTSKGQQREGERVYNKIQEVMNTHNVDKLRFEKRLISNNTYEIYAYIVDETGQVINLQ